MPERKSVLIRIDPALHDALQRWSAAELRSLNGQIEYALRQALIAAGRMSQQPDHPADGTSDEKA